MKAPTNNTPQKQNQKKKKKALKREWKSMSKKREEDKIFLQIVLLSTAVKKEKPSFKVGQSKSNISTESQKSRER